MASAKNRAKYAIAGFEKKLLKAKDFKAQGTKCLNEGNFEAAIDKYQQILDTLVGGKEMGCHETERKDLETERKDLIQVNVL